MFLHLSVILFTGRVSTSVHTGIPIPPTPWEKTPLREETPPGADTPNPPPLAHGYSCGRYASYWVAFLLQIVFWLLLDPEFPSFFEEVEIRQQQENSQKSPKK